MRKGVVREQKPFEGFTIFDQTQGGTCRMEDLAGCEEYVAPQRNKIFSNREIVRIRKWEIKQPKVRLCRCCSGYALCKELGR